jgi:hypothetical protein
VKIATFAKPETIVVHFRKTAMNKIKTEILILVILWIVSLTTYSFALMNNYVLHTSDYLGLFGLIVVSTISYFRPEKLFGSILILLIFGLLNIKVSHLQKLRLTWVLFFLFCFMIHHNMPNNSVIQDKSLSCVVF